MAQLKPTRTQATVASVKQFVVGTPEENPDFTHTYIEQMIVDLAKWFNAPESGVNYPDPLLTAREKVKDCLLGLKADGSVWDTAPDSFKTRLKIKANYDLDAKRGVPTKRKIRKLDPKATGGAKAVTRMTPISSILNVPELTQQYIADILSVFPELDNLAHIPNVESLADIYAQRKVISGELALGVTVTRRTVLLDQMKMIEATADSMMNKLGIHPNQVKKKISTDANGSVADLVAHISEDEDFRQREKVWALQLALQFWWQSEHNNYNKDGPQLSDFEIFHSTRSRPCRFKCRCGVETLIVEGFRPHELRDWLMKEGVLVEVPVMPQLMSAVDLAGLATFIPEVETDVETIP